MVWCFGEVTVSIRLGEGLAYLALGVPVKAGLMKEGLVVLNDNSNDIYAKQAERLGLTYSRCF